MAIWRVTVAGNYYNNNEQWNNVFHIDSSGTPGTATLDAFENAYNVAATGGGMSFLNPCPGTVATGVTGVKMDRIMMQAVVAPAPPIVRSVSHQGGQNTAGGLPLDVTPCLSWTTARAGRSYRGRTYLPVWHENQNDDTGGVPPQPLGTSITGVLINAKKLVNDLVAASTPLVIYSRVLAAGQAVTGGYMDTNWDTQRRRSKSQSTVRATFTIP
jgi:hypothetical protein